MEKYAENLGKVREEIYNATKDKATPTVVNMARNAIMFLDTAYMWCDTLNQMIASMDADKQAEDPNVKVVDFTGARSN